MRLMAAHETIFGVFFGFPI